MNIMSRSGLKTNPGLPQLLQKRNQEFTISRHCSLTNILRAIISFSKSSEAPFFLKSYQITLRGAQSKNFPGLQKHNTSFLPID